MIKLEHLSVRRGATQVLHDISAEIPRARITAVVGPSGAGKSTLLATLNGLLRPSLGRITVDGARVLEQRDSLREYRRRTATVFQEHALIDRLSAIDNVLLGLADQRHPLSPLPWPQAMRYRAAEALDEVGLLQRSAVRASNLSGGERQRVGVARALIRKPSLLLGDEPFAAVDPALVRQMGDILRRMAMRDGMTVILVMHQIDIALSLADKVIALAAGRIVFDGAPASFNADVQRRIFRVNAAKSFVDTADSIYEYQESNHVEFYAKALVLANRSQ
ncbi:phosphonate ABC transporter ATP-binding protein [Candidatus Methylobacter oryzae]|uniref:ATP-binding cassette domain-containing protein n=1 Tax=Candidatus Methylobacter oryzae TaxID=2497749 RepID=A0ABY3C4H5_9GAMM|nr:ATP-binding cassette domain-containing protein [Candidatus Methylobacter oryzae]TRW89616.1 ATP-binding cassette domain-containing protein [Candidatus Methylobacter oryzae]